MAVKLSKKTLFKVFAYWSNLAVTMQNMERMEAPVFCGAMCQAAEELYPGDKEKQKEYALRHAQFYNSHVITALLNVGLALGMEEEKANGADVPPEIISSTKTALMGPLAGIGDSLITGTFIPILLSIGLGMSGTSGSVAGPLFYLAAWLVSSFFMGWFLFKKGYSSGISGVTYMMNSGITEKAIRFATIVGLFITGCITGQYVTADFGIVYQSGELQISLASKINGIFPGLCPLLLTLFAYWLIEKKKLKMGMLFIVFILLALVSSLTGLLA